jgi:uncharacterized membrane protein
MNRYVLPMLLVALGTVACGRIIGDDTPGALALVVGLLVALGLGYLVYFAWSRTRRRERREDRRE